jgi:hypothetical protein
MSGFAAGLLAGFLLGGSAGLWLGFKLWRQSFVSITNVRRWPL